MDVCNRWHHPAADAAEACDWVIHTMPESLMRALCHVLQHPGTLFG
jgi:hypothetical protein